MATEDAAENADAGLGEVGLRRLMRAVAQRDVRDLVREHAGDFAFVARVVEHTAIDVNESARQRERVDVRLIHDAELILEVRTTGVASEALSDLINVRVDLRIIEHRQLLLRRRRRLLADFDVLFRRK